MAFEVGYVPNNGVSSVIGFYGTVLDDNQHWESNLPSHLHFLG